MSKRRKPIDDEDDGVEDSNQQLSCTTLDHVYPAGDKVPGRTTCFCGKRIWKPLIQLDDYLKEGMIIRLHSGGSLYEVVMVNQSRAYCWPVTPTEALEGTRSKMPTFMPIPGSPAWDQLAASLASGEAGDRRAITDGGINISPRSAVERVTHDDLLNLMTQSNRRSSDMATHAGLPIAGGGVKQSNKDKNKARLAALAKKPASAARPLTGAAAKAKANAKPKAERKVRQCGCGCGEETMSYFVPGHDARFKGWLKKVGDGRMSLDELKKAMGQKTFGKYTFKKSGQGFVPKETYQEVAG